MAGPSLALIGCGDLGVRCGLRLAELGWGVHAAKRSPSTLPGSLTGHAADYTQPGSLDFLAALRPDFVVATFNPSSRDLAGYRAGFCDGAQHLVSGLGKHRPRGLLMVSSTRVYAEQEGGWVEEGSELSNSDSRAVAIIEAERILQARIPGSSSVRFAGIYGNPRSRLLARIAEGKLSPREPVRYSNRIHRDDCAGFLSHLLLLAESGAVLKAAYNGVDDCPAPQSEVDAWLAEQLGVDPGVDQDRSVAQAPSSSQGRSGHKRCRNTALHESGYRLHFPDYRAGYSALLRDLQAAGRPALN